jgi:LacI family transcriptional regulator
MTMRELARLAKLSPAAVSLALRDSPKISAPTKLRVRRLAQSVGYKPDATLTSIMSYLRTTREARRTASFAVISFYPTARPWEQSLHLQRIYQSMKRRADELGYGLEPLWLREPGMNVRRFRDILEARGIEGLLCFGGPVMDEEFPAELSQFAVVTQGQSIAAPLHRVVSHAFNNTVAALKRLYQLGYRRPGLVLGRHEDLRDAHVHSGAYFSWCEHRLGLAQALPILRLDEVEAEPLMAWLKKQRPDSLVFVHTHDVLPRLGKVLRENGVRVPQKLGVAVISPVVEGSGFDGLQENQRLIGSWMIELLAARIANHDLGIPANPRIEMVESEWIPGSSLGIPPPARTKRQTGAGPAVSTRASVRSSSH